MTPQRFDASPWSDPKGRVPIEYTGRARALRSKVLKNDERASALMFDICHPITCRLRTHARVRDETLAGVARRWRVEVPARFRLSLDVVRDRHHGTRIAERRVAASLMKCPMWDDRTIARWASA